MSSQTASPPVTASVDGSPEDFAIYCRQLSKSYGPVQALQNLDLAVPYGSIFGFLGRNGAGKTTTMRMLAGLAQPSSGQAWVAGLETTSANRQARARFGYLPQDPTFYSWMKAQEYLSYVGQIQGLAGAELKRQVAEMLELSDLKEAARRRIGGFSGGMLQRLGIAQALIGSPPVLLLDEPTSALDPAGRYEVLAMLTRLSDRGTVFLSSHILADIERVCDTIAVLHKGQLVLVAGRDELMERYPVNAAELEFESIGAKAGLTPEALAGFLAELEQRPWVANTVQEDAHLRVMVQDVSQGKQELMPLVVAHGLVLNRYEWVRPTLEEIFLQLSS